MSITEFLSLQTPDRKKILSAIHEIIITADRKVKPETGKMMGTEMIQYKAGGVFIYGLASVKSHMSLHAMPIYGSPELRSKYEKLLSKAKFQKGCINFKKEEEMPLEIVRDLLNDCAKIDLIALWEKFKKNPVKRP